MRFSPYCNFYDRPVRIVAESDAVAEIHYIITYIIQVECNEQLLLLLLIRIEMAQRTQFAVIFNSWSQIPINEIIYLKRRSERKILLRIWPLQRSYKGKNFLFRNPPSTTNPNPILPGRRYFGGNKIRL